MDGGGPGHFGGASASSWALWESFQEEVRAELRGEGPSKSCPEQEGAAQAEGRVCGKAGQ